MPETKTESLFFTALTAWVMVYIMTLYNTVLSLGYFTNDLFLVTLRGMWAEYILIFLLAFFVSGPKALRLGRRLQLPSGSPIFTVLSIQIFTVLLQVAFASILGVYHGAGFTVNFIPDYICAYCRNFALALPVQVFLVGPAVRRIFRALFRRSARTTPVFS